MRRLIPIILAAGLLVTACQRARNGGAIAVSLIREPSGNAILREPTEQGLVRLDREGQVVPAAALRWAILDDGLDYIFRIDDAVGLSAETVARRLRDALRRHRRNPEIAAMAPIESIQAVTNTVVEIRLTVPQPDLLPLLARPDFAVGAPAPLRGGKPRAGARLLEPRPGEDAAAILLRSERAGRAVARFQAGEAQLVLGGTFADLPVARVAQPPRRALRFDPATGLFGFAIRNASLPAEVRTALSLAIDRDRIVALVGAPAQAKATTIAGSTLEPPLAQRRATALALLAGRQTHIRVAMPRGPGASLLFALVAQDWARMGISAEMAGADARDADLILVDRVAPAGTLATLACALSAGCDPRDRLQLINPPFIPVSTPVRWSLVAPGLDLFTDNTLAAHPLDQLRSVH
jgi:peptide/nickel transport system substrate-binding protein